MKNYYRLIWILLLAAFYACSKSNEEPPIVPDKPEVPEIIDPDSTIVKLKAIGDFTASPLSRAGANDLYALQVTQINEFEAERGDGVIVTERGYGYYAIGVFDDINLAVIKLAKKYKYCFDLAYIPNGKNIIHQYPDGSYGNPCSCYYGEGIQVNEMRYDTNDWLWLQFGSSQVKGKTSYMIQENFWNPVCRYQGYVDDIDPNVTDVVSIDLYKQVIGFKIIVDDFTKGKIFLSCEYDSHVYSQTPAANSSTNILQIEIEPPYIESPKDPGAKVTFVQLFYDEGDGKRIPLFKKEIEYERNKLYTLRFSLSDAIANGGITTNIIDDSDEMTEVPIEI